MEEKQYQVKQDSFARSQTEIITEPVFPSISGEVWAILKDNDTGKEEKIYIGKNVITVGASILIARLLKDATSTNGLLYLSVGTGALGWNLQNPPAATSQQTQLEAELFRKSFSKTAFIKTDGSGDESTIPTNIVDYTTTFAEAEAVGPLVEMGLYGGDATGVPNSGALFNYRTFPVINKSPNSTLTLVWRITT